MSNIITNLAPKILEEIQVSNKILLHCHPNPDPDSVGGVLAMAAALKQLEKTVVVIGGDSPLPQSMKGFPGADTIVGKSFGEIDLQDFDLFIIQDSSSLEMISKKTTIGFPDHLKTIVIDHHITNSKFGSINLVEPSYPAVCLILFDLFTLWDIQITPDIAINLFMGIYTDTGFKYAGTTSYCFEVAAKLTTIAPDFDTYIFDYENSAEKKDLEFMGLALSHIESYCNDSVAIIPLSYKLLQQSDIEKKNTLAHLANLLISVRDWKIGITLIETDPGIVKASFRTRDFNKYNVSLLAKKLGGGGHPAAAGASLIMSIEEAKEKVLEEISDLYSFS